MVVVAGWTALNMAILFFSMKYVGLLRVKVQYPPKLHATGALQPLDVGYRTPFS